jgi:hypothetical protein
VRAKARPETLLAAMLQIRRIIAEIKQLATNNLLDFKT